MDEGGPEINQEGPTPNKKESERPLTTKEQELITKSLDLYQEMCDEKTSFANRERHALEETNGAARRINYAVENSNYREPNQRILIQERDMLLGQITPQLRSFEEKVMRLGLADTSIGEIHHLLTQAVREEDPIRAFAIADHANELFDVEVGKIETNIEGQDPERNRMRAISAEGADRARSLMGRTFNENPGMNLSESSIWQYKMHTQELAENIEELPKGQALVEDARQRSFHFKSYVQELIRPEPPAQN